MNLNPIPPVLEALAKVFEAIKNAKPVNLLIICSFLGGMAYLYNSKSGDGHPSPEVESVRFERQIRSNAQVQTLLETSRLNINSDRLVIRLFHNSQMGNTGIPFQYVKTTSAAVRAGVSQPPELYMDYPSQSVNNLLADMFLDGSPHCVILKQEDAKDAILQKSMRDLGVAMTYSCPILTKQHFPVGYISAGYLDTDRKRPDDQAIFDRLTADAQAYSLEMASITEGENDSLLTAVWKWVGKKLGVA
jgi:hypothetical protein